ncbi:hypothetical protein CCUS01_07566 [Colletotrichum cuscutae]|uniref:Uncharacterized protein n=1 Tax=Colletotrichum cuscutae TaxID=1209917 RepID=A0AAI9UXR0_9PEZI|nr:hypothetical protein CCUS01_07566 [Colletotrichum cuscutae]
MESQGVSSNERHGSAAAGGETKKTGGGNPQMGSLLGRATSEVGRTGSLEEPTWKNQERIGRRQEGTEIGIGPAGVSVNLVKCSCGYVVSSRGQGR